MSLRRHFLIAVLVAAPALAQQPPQKTTEQQARSYVASAFITGAAPMIISEKVIVSPALRQYLGLAPDADGPATYKAMMNVTAGKQLTVRRAAADEISAAEAPAPASQQPIFALEAGSATLILQYDLARDNISFVGLPGAVATPAPEQKPLQVVEPSIPRLAKPAASVVAPSAARPVLSMQEPPRPPLKPSGPCVIKPVMSDQDLVNCGATPR